MSWGALAWASSVRTGHAPSKQVLVLLANYADENGECFPSLERLVGETELADRTVRKCLSHLEELGLLERVHRRRPNGTMAPARFKLHVSDATSNAGGDQRHDMPVAI